jgi:mono/diheme cytochrome c family protein
MVVRATMAKHPSSPIVPRKRALFIALVISLPSAVTGWMVGCAPDEGKSKTSSVTKWDAATRPDADPKKPALPDGRAPGADDRPPGDPAMIERGRYLVDHVAGCGDCHTPGGATPDTTKYLAGVECLVNVNGACLHSGNLTSSSSGLARRSDATIKAMFMNGRRPEGGALNPIMPYWVYHNMKDEDADAIVAYLRTVPPVEHIVPPTAMGFITRSPAAPIDPATIPKAKGGGGDGGANVENGRYLAGMVGRCLACHTPSLPQGSARPIDMRKPFGGDQEYTAAGLGLNAPPYPEKWYSTNITPAPVSGIGGWSVADIQRAMREGRDKNNGRMCPPMPFGPTGTYGGLTDQDSLDIATYIANLPPIDRFTKGGGCLVQLDE